MAYPEAADPKGSAGAPENNRLVIAGSLAKRLYEVELRLEGDGGPPWAELDDFTKAFYKECVWSLLGEEELLGRFLNCPTAT